MEKGLEIDYDTADRITLTSLKDHRKILKKEIKDYLKKDKWLHADDVIHNTELVKALELLITYYGGPND